MPVSSPTWEPAQVVETTVAMLRTAGFRQVGCIYQFMKFATVVAIK